MLCTGWLKENGWEGREGKLWGTTLGLLQQMMHQLRLTPEAVSWSAAISSCEKGKYAETGNRLLQQMPSRAVQRMPSRAVQPDEISACEKGV